MSLLTAASVQFESGIVERTLGPQLETPRLVTLAEDTPEQTPSTK